MYHRPDCRKNNICNKKRCRRDCPDIDIDLELNKTQWEEAIIS